MTFSRRHFLQGALTVTAAVTIPLIKSLPLRPILWADGIHDDTDSFEALLNGEPVDLVNDAVRLMQSGAISLNGGIYKLTKTILVDNGRYVSLSNLKLKWPNGFEGFMFEARNHSYLRLNDLTFERPISFVKLPGDVK